MSDGNVLFQATGYLERETCIGCDKPDRECLALVLADHAGPYCQKCIMREARKRSKNGTKHDTTNQ